MNAVVEPTVDDFVRMGAAGIFPEDAHIELIEGDLIDMPPIGTGHGALTNRLNRPLVLAAGDDAIVSPGNPVVLPPRSTLQVPDAPFRVSPAALPGHSLSSDDLWPAAPAGR